MTIIELFISQPFQSLTFSVSNIFLYHLVQYGFGERINSQSLEDAQAGYTFHKHTLEKCTFEKYTFELPRITCAGPASPR